jgi:hypothetical protein
MAALGRHRFPRFAIASSVSSVARRSKRSPKRILKSTSIFSICSAARLRDTDQVVAAGTFLPVKGRVARALLDLAKAFGNEVGGGRVVIRRS